MIVAEWFSGYFLGQLVMEWQVVFWPKRAIDYGVINSIFAKI
jgi:hypothetical protein